MTGSSLRPNTTQRFELARLSAGLKQLWQRSGEAIGDAYAVAATAFLERRERLTDLNAERKFHHHTSSSRATRSP
jgi:hypothetical protein